MCVCLNDLETERKREGVSKWLAEREREKGEREKERVCVQSMWLWREEGTAVDVLERQDRLGKEKVGRKFFQRQAPACRDCAGGVPASLPVWTIHELRLCGSFNKVMVTAVETRDERRLRRDSIHGPSGVGLSLDAAHRLTEWIPRGGEENLEALPKLGTKIPTAGSVKGMVGRRHRQSQATSIYIFKFSGHHHLPPPQSTPCHPSASYTEAGRKS